MFKTVIASFDMSLSDRTVAALDGIASVLRTDPDTVSLRDAVARAKPDLVLIDTDSSYGIGGDLSDVVQHIRDADSEHVVIALGDEGDAAAVLAAIRSGVKDFLSRASGSDGLRAQVVSHLGRTPRREKAEAGNLLAIISGQPNDGESMYAINYAVLRAQHGNDVLLVDFNLPSSEAGAALDMDMNYTVRDAVHDLSRLDRTLLSAALGKHAGSGLHVLPLALTGEGVNDLTPSAIMSLLLVLRGLFAEIVLNVGSIRHSGLLAELAQSATSLHFVTTQKFTSLKACKELLSQVAPGSSTRERITLVIDDYNPDITLSEQQIATTMELKRSARIPTSRAALVNSLNRGRPLVMDEPRSAYTRALQKLANISAKRPPAAAQAPRGFARAFTRLVPHAT